MKKALLAAFAATLLTTSANAADVDYEPSNPYNWTGFYLGLNAGAAFNNSRFDNNLAGPILGPIGAAINTRVQADETVFTGGIQASYLGQMDSFVYGLATDFNFMDFRSSRGANLGGGNSASFKVKGDWYGTTVAQLGFAAGNLLFFGTGGVAYGHASADGEVFIGANTWRGSDSNINVGWTAGAGIKYAVVDTNWVIGAEYKYVDLGKSDFNYNSTSLADSIRSDTTVAFSVLRATIDFKF